MGMKTPRRYFASHASWIRHDPRWAVVRWDALRRDGFRCVKCTASGRLEVDHVKPIRTHPDLAFELSNLQALCRSCHSRKTRIDMGKPDEIEERKQWRSAVSWLVRTTPPRRETDVELDKDQPPTE